MPRAMFKHAACTLLVLFLGSFAEGTTYWVKGVSPTGGWYDADKTLQGDEKMCWAATAANMLAWWQDKHPEAAADGPQGAEEVWGTFRKAFDGSAGETYLALQWWFSGKTPPQAMPQTEEGKTLGGWLKARVEEKGTPFPGQDVLLEEPAEGMSRRIKELLCNGYAVGIGIRRLDKEHHILPVWHMLSLWGIEYDEERECITRVYLTDSDDIAGEWPKYQRGLFAADATEADLVNEKGRPFAGLILRNRVGWFKGNCTITTLVALHEDTACAKEEVSSPAK